MSREEIVERRSRDGVRVQSGRHTEEDFLRRNGRKMKGVKRKIRVARENFLEKISLRNKGKFEKENTKALRKEESVCEEKFKTILSIFDEANKFCRRKEKGLNREVY